MTSRILQVAPEELIAGDRLRDGRTLLRLMYDGAGDVWQTDRKPFKPGSSDGPIWVVRERAPAERCDGMGV